MSTAQKANQKFSSRMLSVKRGKSISSVEGLTLSPRMGKIFAKSGLSGDERRALIRAQFKDKKSA